MLYMCAHQTKILCHLLKKRYSIWLPMFMNYIALIFQELSEIQKDGSLIEKFKHTLYHHMHGVVNSCPFADDQSERVQ